MYFDTHAHYDDEQFQDDRNDLLNELNSSLIDFIINPGCDTASTINAMEIAHSHSFVYFASGIHPENLENYNTAMLDEIRRCALDSKCVAIGEIGLDYYWNKENKELQNNVFEAQLRLAIELDLPVIIHDREAHEDSMNMIRKYPEARGVFHCYSGSAEMAEELLKRGWYLGFDGPVTYKNARKTVEVAQICPLERMLLETDSPYLSPVPKRGTRNNSSNLVYVAAKIAEIKGMTEENIRDITKENALRLFGKIKSV